MFRPGEKLFQKGGSIREIHIIRSGKVKIFAPASVSEEQSRGQKRKIRLRNPNVDLELVYPLGIVGGIDSLLVDSTRKAYCR